MKLLDTLAAQANRPDDVRAAIGTVAVVSGRTIDVQVQGATVPGIPVADSYPSPAQGDVVLVAKIGSAWLALTTIGKIAGTPGGPNMVVNPGFETGAVGGLPDGWATGWGAVLAAATDQAHHYGERALKIPLVSGATGEAHSATPLQVAPGTLYRVGFWHMTEVPFPAGASLRVRVYTAESSDDTAPTGQNAAIATIGPVSPTVVGQWAYFEGTFTVPSPHIFARVNPRYDWPAGTPVPTPGSVYFDDLTFRTAS